MRVQKRGTRGFEAVKFDKIVARLTNLTNNIENTVDPIIIAQSVIKNIYDGITTEELDRISARAAESYKLRHPNYSTLAARIIVSNMHKTTPKSFSDCSEVIFRETGGISEQHMEFIRANAGGLDEMIVHERDYLYGYIGISMLENAYLRRYYTTVHDHQGRVQYVTKAGANVKFEDIVFHTCVPKYNGKKVWPKQIPVIIDRPQYMLMRVAIATCCGDLNRIKQAYDILSLQYATHATPTNYNACSKDQQLNSCFLLGMRDNIKDIMDTLTDASLISKSAGGIGIWMHDVRPYGDIIKSTGGLSSGICRQLKMFDNAAECWNQGGKRKGSFAIYLEPWHGDILDFLELKNNTRGEAKSLFYAMWVPDLFFKRAEAHEDWSLFSSNTAPGLSDVYDGMEVCKKCQYCANSAYNKYISTARPQYDICDHEFVEVDAFTKLYTKYENSNLAIDVVSAWDVLNAICESQRDNGTPYVCAKDSANRMTNQKNIGTIKSSNLCTEIMEWSSADSYACCTLASINLPKFIVDGKYDFKKLHEVVEFLTESLDNVIDANSYPVPECSRNSYDFRPIGLGVQGLAKVFAALDMPFVSEEAKALDLAIFETIYHAAVTKSAELAKSRGAYSAFDGSPASRGILAHDMWAANQKRLGNPLGQLPLSGMYGWESTRELASHGLRNSLLVAPMPTASTSAILGNSESFEPFGAHIGTQNRGLGKITFMNSQLVNHLIDIGVWSERTKFDIINNAGSLKGLDYIPDKTREVYKTVYEISQLELMRRASLRQAFVDQSQSLNIYLNTNTDAVLRAVFFNGWKMGLKTISYYLTTDAAVKAMKNNQAEIKKITETSDAEGDTEGDDGGVSGAMCVIGEDGCVSCTS